MHNSSEIINEIREQADIVSIISSYIPLEKKGKNYFAVCPFHDDHNPSMSVSQDKQIYKCFVCGASGNVFSFVKDYENVSFLEAVKIVGEHVGINFNNSNIKVPVKKHKKELELMDFACKYYQLNLNSKDGLKALNYLKTRHIDEKIIEEFKIGLSLKKMDNLTQILKQKGYDIDFLDKLGLSFKESNNDTFINRIMFPLHDKDGQVIGFSARIYNDEKDQAKYINTKETIIFKKGKFLYNYHVAKKEVKKDKKIIIVEGQMDVIRLCSVGIKNCIALSGTALTSEQVDLIKKLKVPVYLVLDNDNAGELATFRNGEILDNNNVDVKVVRLLNAKDPDEFILKYQREEFEKFLNKPISYLSFKMNYLKKNKNLKETKDLVKYVNEVLESLQNEDDDLTIEIVLKKLSKEYDLDYYNLLNRLKNNKSKSKLRKKEPKEKEEKKQKKNKYILASEAILYFMLQDPIYIKMYQRKLGYLSSKEHRDLVNDILYFYELNKYINMADFITFVEEKNLNEKKVKEILIDNDKVKVNEKEMENYIKVVEEGLIKEKIAKLKKELKEEVNEMKKIEIVKEITKLKKEV